MAHKIVRLLSLVSILFSFAIHATTSVVGQVENITAFRKRLERVTETRAAVKTFLVRMNGLICYRNLEIGDAKINMLAKVEVEIACDLLTDRWVIISHTEPLLPGLAPRPSSLTQAEAAGVYLVDGLAGYRFTKNRGFVALRRLEEIPIPDPLTLGCGFCPEIKRFIPFSMAMDNLYTWDMQGFREEKSGPLVTYRKPIFEKPTLSSTLITFDTMRGGMVTMIERRSGDRNENLLRGTVEPILIDGHWIPHRVLYTCGPTDFLTWELDWISVNKPLPTGLFEIEKLSFLLGKGNIDDFLD